MEGRGQGGERGLVHWCSIFCQAACFNWKRRDQKKTGREGRDHLDRKRAMSIKRTRTRAGHASREMSEDKVDRGSTLACWQLRLGGVIRDEGCGSSRGQRRCWLRCGNGALCLVGSWRRAAASGQTQVSMESNAQDR